jgi:hypothetical protein
MAAALVSKGSFPFGLQPDLDQSATVTESVAHQPFAFRRRLRWMVVMSRARRFMRRILSLNGAAGA